jgi:V8-like Glu-specific endopeptidase
MLSARNADSITSAFAPDAHAAPARPSGPAGRVAGTTPVQSLAGPSQRIPAPARSGVAPKSGQVGSGWPGNFYQPPATTTGKVFFTTYNGQRWVCSASTVNSNGKDAVITAGHCVYGSMGGEVPGEGWHSNWMFVPDYYYGYAPYGVWTASQLWTLTNYVYNQDEGDDIGAVVINTNAYGQHIVNVVGGQGFAWNFSPYQYLYDFGYPAAAPFNGLSLQYCNGYEFSWPYVSSTMGLACNFTGGSSGGPWLMWFNGEFGYINGVNDFGYSSLPGDIFSAYFGNNADALYNAVANL